MDAPIQLVHLSSIKYDDNKRVRQDLDPEGIKELAESIEQVGLMNAIIVTKDGTLLAGRRRLAAYVLLKRPEIPVRYWEDLDEITKLVVELDENRKRKQLTYMEEVLALKRLHDLKSKADRHWTLGETAAMVGISTAKLSEDLLLASMSSNERVTNRPTRSGALNAAKRERELELVRELARRRADTVAPETGLKHETVTNGTLYLGDCRTLLKSLKDNSVDLIFTDPPWGVNFQSSTQWAKSWAPTYDDSWEHIQALLTETLPHWYRVLKEGCHFYTFFGASDHGWWIKALTDVGFRVRARPLIWLKNAPAITDLYTSFQPVYESLLWGWKPGEGEYRRFFDKPVAEGYLVPRTKGLYHVNEKPVELVEKFVEASSATNELVLDPFMGGGSTAVAAFQLGRTFMGCELDEGTYRSTLDRLRGEEQGDDRPNQES